LLPELRPKKYGEKEKKKVVVTVYISNELFIKTIRKTT
jgi:hypothetical protein